VVKVLYHLIHELARLLRKVNLCSLGRGLSLKLYSPTNDNSDNNGQDYYYQHQFEQRKPALRRLEIV